MEYLAHSKELELEAERDWHEKFVRLDGYEMLYCCVERISGGGNGEKMEEKEREREKEKEGGESEVVREILETGLNLLN